MNSGSDLSGEKIFWATVLNASITLAEIVGGFLSGSLALLSDAIHNFSDTIVIAVSYFANKIGHRPADAKKTFGYKRVEILSAFINLLYSQQSRSYLIYEAIQRFQCPERIDGNLNIKSSYLHLLSNTISSVGVLIGGVMIRLWNAFWIDSFITVLIALYILKKTWEVNAKTVSILMQSSATLDYEKIKKEIEDINSIRNIHHIHTWLLDEKTIYFEAHIEVEDRFLSQIEIIYDEIESLLKDHYGVSYVTLQTEVDRGDERIGKL